LKQWTHDWHIPWRRGKGRLRRRLFPSQVDQLTLFTAAASAS
jgi:hypothetical protein